MEHIKGTLGNYPKEPDTRDQRNFEPLDEGPTIEERRERLRQSLGVGSLDNTFDNFKAAKGTLQSFRAFKALADGTTHRKMLLCYGGVGNGKTHLCEATVIELYKQGIFCRVHTMARILRSLKSSLRPEVLMTYDELIQAYSYCKYLVVDDVGMGGSGSEWEFGQLEELTVNRYREKLFTIFTTNRDLTELPERVVSRFYDPDIAAIILNEGKDYRKLKGGK